MMDGVTIRVYYRDSSLGIHTYKVSISSTCPGAICYNQKIDSDYEYLGYIG